MKAHHVVYVMYGVIVTAVALLVGRGPVVSADASNSSFERDRAAILAMAGQHRVIFDFRETAPLRPGYTVQEPYSSAASEWVEVIEDTGERISLQHVLVVKRDDGTPVVIKHWRQDWTYEPDAVLAFEGGDTWAHVRVAPDARRGAWSQEVYSVDDGPRYGAVGRWIHEGDFSVWESERSARPLPRRERDRRSEYDRLLTRHRLTVFEGAWHHEQDSIKCNGEAEPQEYIAREWGLNTYTHDADLDLAEAEAYWNRTEAFWADVRAAWDALLAGSPLYTVETSANSASRFSVVRDLEASCCDGAEAYTRGEAQDTIRKALAPFVTPEPSATASRSGASAAAPVS